MSYNLIVNKREIINGTLMEDVIVIGAGVVGAAVSYYLSSYNLKVTTLEKYNDVSCGTSKANSAIIHAGYDPKENTKMARLNVYGSELTKQVCQKLDVPYKQCGALVLAFNDEEDKHVLALFNRGNNNGVKDLKVLNHDEVLELEPNINPSITSALYAPTSAIVSPWELTIALMETAVKNGVTLKLNNEVKKITKENDIFTIKTDKDVYQTKYVINCAGLYSDKINEMVNEKSFTINSVKGEYFLLDKAEGNRCSHTIFQCPNNLGKGVLVSPTVHGNLIVGPNAVNSDKEDLGTTKVGLNFIKKLATKSIPSIDFRENIRNFAGNRSKSEIDDFIVEESQTTNFYNCAAIASPGLSSALAIGQEVLDWLKSKQDLEKKISFIDERKVVRLKNLSIEERNKLIKENPLYGRIICRCESISEGEIVNAIRGVIPCSTIDSIKRRCNSSMGRCQGSFCGPKIMEIIHRELGKDYLDINQDQNGSYVVYKEAK